MSLALDSTSTFVAFESIQYNNNSDDDGDDDDLSKRRRSSPGDDVPIRGDVDRSFEEIVTEALIENEEIVKTSPVSGKTYPFLRRGEGRSCLGSPSPVKKDQYPSRDKENETKKPARRFSQNILRKRSMRQKKRKKTNNHPAKVQPSSDDKDEDVVEKFGALDEIVFGQSKQLLTSFDYEVEEPQRDNDDDDDNDELAEFEALEKRLASETKSTFTVKDLRSRLQGRAITTSQLFGFMDSDRSDRLTANEIQNGLALAGIHVDMSRVRSVLKEFDLNEDRSVSWSEFRDAMELDDDMEMELNNNNNEEKNEDEYTWGSLHHLSNTEASSLSPPKQEQEQQDISTIQEEDVEITSKSSLVRSYFPEEGKEGKEEVALPKQQEEVKKTLQDRLQQQLTRLDTEIVQYEQERRIAAEKKQQLKRAQDQLARDRAAFETWREEQRVMTEKWISEQQNKMKKRKAVLDRQAKAMYNHVPDRKERKEIETLKATIAQRDLERKKSDSKWRLNVQRLESKVRTLESRVNELLDEMDCMNQERLEHMEERQRWEQHSRRVASQNSTKTSNMRIKTRKKSVENKVVVDEPSKPIVPNQQQHQQQHHHHHQQQQQQHHQQQQQQQQPQPKEEKHENFVEKTFPDGKIERRYRDGRVEMIFRNGTRKVMSTDPSFGGSVSCTIYFSNGDVKRTDPSGTVTYFYAAANTTHTTRVDGVEIFEFPSGQKETHYVDGRKDILFEDGTKKTIFPNKEEHSLFPDGTKVVEYPDGTKRVISPDGSDDNVSP